MCFPVEGIASPNLVFSERWHLHSIVMKQSNNAPSSILDTPIPGLNISTAIALFLLVTCVLPLYFTERIPNALGLTILFFNNLNMLICFCEIALGNHIKFIKRDYQERKRTYEGKEYKAAFYYLTMPLSLSTLFSGEKWAIMWSTYALWDPSYQNQESFGFFIDVGNGWSTIPTAILWDVAIFFPGVLESSWEYSWLLVGVLGCASYWQVCYGTLVYFLSYL